MDGNVNKWLWPCHRITLTSTLHSTSVVCVHKRYCNFILSVSPISINHFTITNDSTSNQIKSISRTVVVEDFTFIQIDWQYVYMATLASRAQRTQRHAENMEKKAFCCLHWCCCCCWCRSWCLCCCCRCSLYAHVFRSHQVCFSLTIRFCGCHQHINITIEAEFHCYHKIKCVFPFSYHAIPIDDRYSSHLYCCSIRPHCKQKELSHSVGMHLQLLLFVILSFVQWNTPHYYFWWNVECVSWKFNCHVI